MVRQKMTRSRVIRKRKPLATKAYVRKQIRNAGEVKHIDTTMNFASAINTFVPVNLTLITGGTTFSARIGDDVTLKSVEFLLEAQPHLTTPLEAHCRMIIFRWNQDVAPIAGSILLQDASALAPVGLFNTTTNDKKYTILYDRMFNIVPDTSASHVMFRKKIALKNKALWKSATSTAILRGQIFCTLKSDLAANGPDIHIQLRVKYSDL